MKYIINNNNDVYFNLAFEEYVFSNLKEDDYILLWKNDESIVLGKYQNAFEEINIKAVEENNIKVARRSTGGGTVFHDMGNLNYSFITKYDTNSFVNYDKFITPIIEALKAIGVNAHKKRNSDIAIDDMKISGSAQSIKGGRVLHHGTLLFNSDLNKLNEMLKTLEGKFESKSVKSVRSVVTNIRDHLDDKNMSMDDFQELLLKTLFPSGIERISLSDQQLEQVNVLAKEKYSQWEWNYGKSPSFTYEKEAYICDDKIHIKLHIKNGLIDHISVRSSSIPCKDIENILIGSTYSYKGITEILKNKYNIIEAKKLASCFF